MNSWLLRLPFAFILIVGAALGNSQPAVWRAITPETNFALAAFDASSNTYLATRESSQTNVRLYLTKYNALGAQQFKVQVSSFYNDYPIRITGVVAIGSSVFISYYLDGTSAPSSGYVAKVNGISGAVNFNTDQGSAIPYAMTSNGTDLVTTGALVGTGFIRFVSQVNGTQLVQWSFTAQKMKGIAESPDGTVFAVGSISGGGGVIAKANSSVISWTKNPDWTTHTSEELQHVAIDNVNGRVFAAGTGYYGSSSTDLDTILVGYDIAGTGETLSFFGGTEYDEPGALIVDSLGRLSLAAYESRPTASYTHVVRWSPGLVFQWEQRYDAGSGFGRGMALDASNDLYVADQSETSDADARISKFNGTTGSPIFTLLDDPGVDDMATQVYADNAGNIYMCGMADYPYNSYVARLQYSQFVFPTTNVMGGTTLTGALRLHTTATSNTVFALSSSNAGVLSVLPSVTITTGNSEVPVVATAQPVTANTNVTITATTGGNVCAKVLTVLTPLVSDLTVSPNVVVGGNNSTGTVKISGKAPLGGKAVTMSSSLTSAATVPGTVTVSAGSTARTFIVTTFGVTANKGVVITATTGATSRTFFMAVNAPSLTTMTVSPASVKGGLSSTLTLGLNGKAPVGGWKVLTYSGASTFVVVPANVTIPVGMSSETATLTTIPVTSFLPITIFATRSGLYKTITLTLTP